MLLFIQSLLQDDYSGLRTKFAIVIIMWLFVTIAMSIDLLSGWHKARERGEARTSFGLRRTVNKAVMYYALMLFAFMFDCIGTFFYPFPYITMIAAAFLIFIEAKSIFEKAHDKEKRRFNQSLGDLALILDNRDDLLNGLMEVVKRQLSEQEQNEKHSDYGKNEP